MQHTAVPSRDLTERLLRIPLQYKILLANAAILLASLAVCGALAASYLPTPPGAALVGVVGAAALLCCLAALPVQMAVLRLALAPMTVLEETAERVGRGDFEARVALSPLADPRTGRLVAVFNRLLDRVAEDRRRLHEVAARAFRAQEAERTRIARELQEESAQRMAGIQLRLGLLRRTPEGPARERVLEELREELAEATSALRDYARGLHPPALHELGPVAAIQSLARSVMEREAVRVTVEAPDLRGVLSREQELALFRIVQEAVANAVRHAAADELAIRLSRRGAEVVAEVSDDGAGFDLEETAERDACLGILGMQERALYARGSVRVESVPGEGTSVRVRLPVPDALDRASVRAGGDPLGCPAARPALAV